MKLKFEKNLQKVIKNNSDDLVKNYPTKKQPIIQQPKSNLPSCLRCKRNNWTEFTHGYTFRTPESEFIIIKNKKKIKSVFDKTITSQLDYHMLKKIRNILFYG